MHQLVSEAAMAHVEVHRVRADGTEKIEARTSNQKHNDSGTNLRLEVRLWQAADALCGSMGAIEYKQVALGLIFL